MAWGLDQPFIACALFKSLIADTVKCIDLHPKNTTSVRFLKMPKTSL